ncbi:hypothetical protein IAU59_001185 [Kwoniella sp. CBS 9459]
MSSNESTKSATNSDDEFTSTELERLPNNPPAISGDQPLTAGLKDFDRLAPVHYLIFHYLKIVAPAKLVRVSRELYDELVPQISKKVELNARTYHKFIERAYVQRKPTDASFDPAAFTTSNAPVYDGAHKDFRHVRTLTLGDPYAATELSKDLLYHKLPHGKETWIDSHLSLFPFLERLCFSAHVTQALIRYYLRKALSEEWDDDVEFLFLGTMFNHLKPDYLCCDWHHSMDGMAAGLPVSDTRNDTRDWTDGRGFSLSQKGMGCLIYLANRQCHRRKPTILIHVEPLQIPLALLPGSSDPSAPSSVIYYLNTPLDGSATLSTQRILCDLWQHFLVIYDCATKRFNQSLTSYNIPKLDMIADWLEEIERTEVKEDHDAWKEFKKRLIVREQECPCREA